MRRSSSTLMLLLGLISFGAVLPGCGGNSGANIVKDYDPKVSEKKGAEYKEQMEAAMKGIKKGGKGAHSQGGRP